MNSSTAAALMKQEPYASVDPKELLDKVSRRPIAYLKNTIVTAKGHIEAKGSGELEAANRQRRHSALHRRILKGGRP